MTARNGLLIPADLTLPIKEVQADGLRDLQALVGGYIQDMPHQHERVSVWGDEEGKIKGRPINARATTVWAILNAMPERDLRDTLNGDIAVFGFDPDEGEDLDLDPVTKALIESIAELGTGRVAS